MKLHETIRASGACILLVLAVFGCDSTTATAEIEAAESKSGARETSAQEAARIQATSMVHAMRAYYPFVWAAHEAAKTATDCVGGNPRDLPEKAKACSGRLREEVARIRSQMPNVANYSGCAGRVGQVTTAAVGDLQTRAEQNELWDGGLELADMRRELVACSKLFFCGVLKKPSGPCDPVDLEVALGLRDSPPPSGGHLWLADGREIDRVTLQVQDR